MFFEEEADQDDDQGNKEHEDGNPVDPVHHAEIDIPGGVGVLFFDVQVFGDLAEHSHNKRLQDNLTGRFINCSDRLYLHLFRGISSVGRALAWHARGQGFDSPILHFPRYKPK